MEADLTLRGMTGPVRIALAAALLLARAALGFAAGCPPALAALHDVSAIAGTGGKPAVPPPPI
ncbi:hypothetical protein CCS01_17200 [Rhodopila globiformis]|uniref:Uncharacterized protein n=1 Tax=Rhodopila globiformis TaxID=1071 RepID=A0A2S6NAC5_RHOGL|nr:hypothetical protein CCS01_17200 [Rhodopila globiformis]